MGYTHGTKWTSEIIRESLLNIVKKLDIDRMPSRNEIRQFSEYRGLPDKYTIAVDPDVIPLGSLVYLGAEYGWKIALDTGKAIQGNIIDVYLPDKDECIKQGRKQNIKVWIIESEGK